MDYTKFDMFTTATVFGKEFYGTTRYFSVNLNGGSVTVTYNHANGVELELDTIVESGLYCFPFPNTDVTITPVSGASVGIK